MEKTNKKKFNLKDIKINTPEGALFWVIFAVLALYAVVIVAMLIWALLTTLKDYTFDYADNIYGLPQKWTLQNYIEVLQNQLRYEFDVAGTRSYINGIDIVLNTVIYTLGCAFFQTLAPCVTAYAVARFGKKYKWLNVFTYIVIVTMIIPIVGSTPSEIEIVTALGIYNTIWGMFIMKANFLGMYYLVFLGIFRGIPKSYEEAASIDGAGYSTVFFRIHLPLAMSTFGTIFLIKTIEFWNDYQTPILYLENQNITLAQWYFKLISGNVAAMSYPTMKTTGAMILVLPILILFIALNKKLLGNISLGGIKE